MASSCRFLRPLLSAPNGDTDRDFRLLRSSGSCQLREMKIAELNHAAIHVAEVEKSVDFYQRVLLLEALPRPAFDFPGAWFRVGTQQELHLLGDRELPVHSHNRGTHFALLVDDIDAWEVHLRTEGAHFAPKKSRPDGAYQIFLQDPDGHIVELCTPPGKAD